jgi:hypothetical protein
MKFVHPRYCSVFAQKSVNSDSDSAGDAAQKSRSDDTLLTVCVSIRQALAVKKSRRDDTLSTN